MGLGRILIFVQHLRGIGHLQRSAAIARALAAGGFQVDLVSGGRPVPEIDLGDVTLHQLPWVASPDDSYTRLIGADGRDAAPALHRRRIARLLAILGDRRPDAVMVEMFPFGRSQIGHEMTALIEAARELAPRPLMVSSVRDIVAAKRTPQRYEEMADQVIAWFDKVLVHGDEAVLPFGDSFPAARRIERYLHYTGYVLSPTPAPPGPERRSAGGQVLVSAGGGAFGAALMRAAIEARSSGTLDAGLAAAPWRLVTGPNMPEAEAAALARSAGEGVTVERMRPDFRALLAAARLSVSLCGYNTAMEVIDTGVPAVMVPFGSGRQNEQARRAAALGRRGLAEVVTEAQPSGAQLAAAMDRAAAKGHASPGGGPRIDMSGAETTCRLMARWLARERPERGERLASPARGGAL